MKLQINAAGVSYTCDTDFQELNIPIGATGSELTLVCPRLSQACPQLFCRNNCSGRGVCNYQNVVNGAARPKCECFDTTDTSETCSKSDITGDFLESSRPFSGKTGSIVSGMSMRLYNVGELTDADISNWEAAAKAHTEEYYRADPDVVDFSTAFEFDSDQSDAYNNQPYFTYFDDGGYTFVYGQTYEYRLAADSGERQIRDEPFTEQNMGPFILKLRESGGAFSQVTATEGLSTNSPTDVPIPSPTDSPTKSPTTAKPTAVPTSNPTAAPVATTAQPTAPPTKSPTDAPVTAPPTAPPTNAPTTKSPTPSPTTHKPTPSPSDVPTINPVSQPPPILI